MRAWNAAPPSTVVLSLLAIAGLAVFAPVAAHGQSEGFDWRGDVAQGSGDFEADFPVTIAGRMSRHNVRATIGGGGRAVRLSTGSGDIRILRQGDQP